MLVPTPSPLRHATPHALPDDGVELESAARLFRAPATGRVRFDTARGAVLLRPVNPTDVSAIDVFVRQLSAATRFRRFHSGLHKLKPRQLAGLVDIDHHRRETLVVLAEDRVVALGQYLDQARPAGSVELAVVVTDDWQGLGLGRRLVQTLLTAATAAGHTHATALVQADNNPALRLLRVLGASAEVSRSGASVEVLIPLPVEDAGPIGPTGTRPSALAPAGA